MCHIYEAQLNINYLNCLDLQTELQKSATSNICMSIHESDMHNTSAILFLHLIGLNDKNMSWKSEHAWMCTFPNLCNIIVHIKAVPLYNVLKL
jgi:hypothetical protein